MRVGLAARMLSGSASFSLRTSFSALVCVAVRLTLSITPKAMLITSTDVPPLEINGSGCHDTGNTPVLIAMWK